MSGAKKRGERLDVSIYTQQSTNNPNVDRARDHGVTATLSTPAAANQHSPRVPRGDERPQLAALTGVRFFAAFHVVVFHIVMAFHIVAQTPGESPFKTWCELGAAPFDQSWWIRGIIRSAFTAVSLFFALSGFILTYSCLTDDNQLVVERRGFWAARFARVYPVYFLGLLINLPAFAIWLGTHKATVSPGQATGVAASAVTLLQAWWPLAANAWNAPGWSLSVEAFFYLSFPFIALALRRRTAPQLWTIAALAWLLSLVLPFVYVIADPDGIAADPSGPGRVTWLSDATWLSVVKFNPLVRLPEFVFGMALGLLFGHEAAARCRARRSTRGWAAALALVAIIAIQAVSEWIPYPVLHNGLLLPLFGLLMVDLALGGGWLGWLLSRRPMTLLGDSSYALYILHFAVVSYALMVAWFPLGGRQLMEQQQAIAAGQEPAPPQDQPQPVAAEVGDKTVDEVPHPLNYMFGIIIGSVLFSIAVHKLVEVPARRWIRRRLMRSRLSLPPPPIVADLP